MNEMRVTVLANANDMAIDLGTSSVVIYMKGRGIVLREAAVVAVQRENRTIMAVGDDADVMVGRTPSNVQAIRPLREGKVMDFELTCFMLRKFVTSKLRRSLFSRPRAVMSVPTGINQVEKRKLISTLYDSGIGRTQLLDRPVAAALGVGLQFLESYGSMIVDMGAGATDIAVLSLGQVAVSKEVTIGGDYFDDAIIRYVRRKYNLLIGERSAEELKINLGSAVPRQEQISMEVTGRNTLSGMPRTQEISSAEIYDALVDPVMELVEEIQSVIEKTPPQLASDIFEDGIVFTGGAASLMGLAEAVHEQLNIPCVVADDPANSVVMGCARAMEDYAAHKHLLNDGRRSLMR